MVVDIIFNVFGGTGIFLLGLAGLFYLFLKNKRIRYMAVMFMLIIPVSVYSHPHVYIDNTVSIVFDKDGMKGIRAQWVFDEMFSNMIIADCDRNSDGKLNSDEVKAVKKGYFSNLKQHNYFSYVEIDGKAFRVTYVEDFNASIQDDKIMYSFFIPCHVKASAEAKKIIIAMYDETYYTDIAHNDFACKPAELTGRFEIEARVVDNTKKSFYFGQMHPTEIVLTFKKKS